MVGYYVILGLVSVYTGAYVVHTLRRRAWGGAFWSGLLALLTLLCLVSFFFLF